MKYSKACIFLILIILFFNGSLIAIRVPIYVGASSASSQTVPLGQTVNFTEPINLVYILQPSFNITIEDNANVSFDAIVYAVAHNLSNGSTYIAIANFGKLSCGITVNLLVPILVGASGLYSVSIMVWTLSSVPLSTVHTLLFNITE